MINDGNIEEKEKKKRGRKKKEVVEDTEPKEKKKRGRKKKWEVETSHTLITDEKIIFNQEDVKKDTKILESENYDSEKISFGNLKITVHTNKDNNNIDVIKEQLKNSNINKLNDNKKECKINLIKPEYEEDETYKINKNLKKSIIDNEKKIKILKYHKDLLDDGKEILLSKHRCYHCHHTFPNKPFFLPIEYCCKTQRYKIYGNFCSPNCVKTFAINSKSYNTKAYLVGEMYRKLFGYSFKIKLAPPIQSLIEYGGNLTIDEYRQTFFNDNIYTLDNVNCKIVVDELVHKKKNIKFT